MAEPGRRQALLPPISPRKGSAAAEGHREQGLIYPSLGLPKGAPHTIMATSLQRRLLPTASPQLGCTGLLSRKNARNIEMHASLLYFSSTCRCFSPSFPLLRGCISTSATMVPRHCATDSLARGYPAKASGTSGLPRGSFVLSRVPKSFHRYLVAFLSTQFLMSRQGLQGCKEFWLFLFQ